MIREEFALHSAGTEASLSVFRWEDDEEYARRIRPAIIVCTGGAYKMLSDQENQPMVAAFLAMGFHVASLRYSLTPVHWPKQLCELAESVAILRENAEKWCIASDQIMVSGFSAGGHLAASLGVFWYQPWLSELVGKSNESIRPNAMMLGYPVLVARENYHKGSFKNLLGDDFESRLSEVSLDLSVSKQTAPCFLWHTGEDAAVSCDGTLKFIQKLRQFGVPFELHLFQKGRHSLALATELTDIGKPGYQNECVAQWTGQFYRWAHDFTDGLI